MSSLFHNEEMLVSKTLVSFVCIYLVALKCVCSSYNLFLHQGWSVELGQYTQNNCDTNTGSVLAGMTVMKTVPQ